MEWVEVSLCKPDDASSVIRTHGERSCPPISTRTLLARACTCFTHNTHYKKKKKIEKRAHLKLCLSYYENSQGNKRRKIIKGSYKHGIRRVF